MSENPPAFPNTGNSTWDLRPTDGMTLRDWFATHAPPLPWNFEQPPYQDPSEITDWSAEAVAARNHEEMKRELAREIKWRWHYADMMLSEREKNHG